jgi:hypothetical protein
MGGSGVGGAFSFSGFGSSSEAFSFASPSNLPVLGQAPPRPSSFGEDLVNFKLGDMLQPLSVAGPAPVAAAVGGFGGFGMASADELRAPKEHLIPDFELRKAPPSPQGQLGAGAGQFSFGPPQSQPVLPALAAGAFGFFGQPQVGELDIRSLSSNILPDDSYAPTLKKYLCGEELPRFLVYRGSRDG